VKREHWKSKLGFMWSAIGSAVGLGSIWRFPYIVGQNGGAVFVLLFCIFLICVSLPIMLSEIVIGRKTQTNPSDAFSKLGKNGFWKGLGTMQVLTGFLVSIFYCVICSFTLGYFLEACVGGLTKFAAPADALAYWNGNINGVSWTVGCIIGFMFLSAAVLFSGVQKGIEATNKILMPLLFVFLIFLAYIGLMMPNSSKGLSFLFKPDWSMFNAKVAFLALGQACFGLSVGQGTMVTYGSYLRKHDNLFKITIPVTIAIVIVSLLAGIAIFTALFSVGGKITSGPALLFQTLPVVFSTMKFGALFAFLFFALILFAGLTSQISAMEPFIAYLIDHKAFSRHGAVTFCSFAVLVFAIPVGLSFGVFSSYTIFGQTFFDALASFCVNLLIPLGALSAVALVGWRNPFKAFLDNLSEGTGLDIAKNPILSSMFSFSIRYLAPVVIFIIFLNAFYAG
jgi:neurotransmitter:Na+ symporter, NSS family